MSQCDLVASTSEITCSQPMTEITCSIGSAGQHTSWTRKHLFAPTLYKEPVYEPITSPTTACFPPCLRSFPSRVSRKNIPSQPRFFHFLPIMKKNRGGGSETAAPSCCEFHGWICVGVRGTGQSKCTATFKRCLWRSKSVKRPDGLSAAIGKQSVGNAHIV